MKSDTRKKGCPNPGCEMNIKKHKFKASYNYCPVCSQQLVFVCAKCFSLLDGDDPNHKYCAIHEAERVKPKPIEVTQNAARRAGDIGGKAGGKIKQVGGFVGSKMKDTGVGIKDAMEANHVPEDLLNAGVRVAKDIGTDTIREAGKALKKAAKKKVSKK